MELQKLKYFQTVARLEHVTHAAELLHISQPSLTQAIHSLEEELGVPLFRHSGRRILLTEYGKYLCSRLDSLLPALDNLPKELLLMREKQRKTVKLNILAASSLVINALVSYKQMNPDVIFEFEQSTLRHDNDITVTINTREDDPSHKILQRFVLEESVFLAVPKNSPYAKLSAVELSLVRDEGFVMLSDTRLFRSLCNRFCTVAGFTPKILFESNSPFAVQNIISTGAGVAFWPEHSWGAPNNENVTLLPITSPACKRDLIIELYDRLPHASFAEDFFNYLTEQLKKTPQKI